MMLPDVIPMTKPTTEPMITYTTGMRMEIQKIQKLAPTCPQYPRPQPKRHGHMPHGPKGAPQVLRARAFPRQTHRSARSTRLGGRSGIATRDRCRSSPQHTHTHTRTHARTHTHTHTHTHYVLGHALGNDDDLLLLAQLKSRMLVVPPAGERMHRSASAFGSGDPLEVPV